MKRLFSLVRSLATITAFFAVVAGIGWVTWRYLPDESRVLFQDPSSIGRLAERGAQARPSNPFRDFGNWIQEKLAEWRDLKDVVIAADGTSGGISPLPEWSTGNAVNSGRFFGATETLWQPRRAKLAGVRWSRVVFAWSDVQPGGPRDWRAQFYLQDRAIKRERDNGVELVGLLMNTPRWAAAQPGAGVHSVPAGLNRPIDDPQNVWAAFVRRMAYEYRGRIDTWVIWNEPDIRSEDPNAQYHTWAGDAADYARLLQVGYLAAKQGNPKARVVFGATTYWSDTSAGRRLFLERALDALAAEPQAAANHYYFDAVALNLYTSPDDLGRVAGIYRRALDARGLSAPLWLTETNAVPYDDPGKQLGREQNGFRVTMEQQAAYVVQAFASGLTAGYERMAFHSVMDRSTEDEVWGLMRNDGTMRPAFVAYQTAARYLSGGSPERPARFAGVERPTRRWPAGGYVPNWQVYLVVIDRDSSAPFPAPAAPTPAGSASPPQSGAVASGRQRVSVLWNGDGEPRRVTLPRLAERAALVDKYGRATPLEHDGERWHLTLPAATAHSTLDPEGYYFIGGDPLLLVEQGVAPDAPVSPPAVVG